MSISNPTRAFLCAAVLLASANAPARAQKSGHRAGFDGYGYMQGYYDNNVFSYSDRDRDLYESGLDTSGRFAIEDLADFVTTLALRGDYRWDATKRSWWQVRGLYDGNFYARNTDRTYHRFGLSLERTVARSSVSLDVSVAPDEYLRPLYWRPMPGRPAGVRYAPAVYDFSGVDLDARTRLARRVDGRLLLAFEHRDYSYPFDERDNNTYSIGAGVSVRAGRQVDLSLMVKTDFSMAAGADSLNPEARDVSNNRFGAAVTATWKMLPWLRFSQQLDYGHQAYTTNNRLDASHYDRTDNELESESTLKFGSFDGWQPELFFLYRTSSTSVPAGIAEYGQYDALRWGTQVTYYF